MMIEITDKNKGFEIIKVKDLKSNKEVDKAVDPILYQMILNLEARIAAIEAGMRSP